MTIFKLDTGFTSNMKVASHSVNRPLILKGGHIGEELVVYDLLTKSWLFKTSTVRKIHEGRDFDGNLRTITFETSNSMYGFNVVAQNATLV